MTRLFGVIAAGLLFLGGWFMGAHWHEVTGSVMGFMGVVMVCFLAENLHLKGEY